VGRQILYYFNKICVKGRLDKKKNKGERYSREPRLSDTRFSAKEAKGSWRCTSSMVMWATG